MGITKSLAMFGWPFGLIAAAGMAIVTGIQVAAIASRSFAKGGTIRNAGVVQGASHGNKYGESGIQLIDRQSGMEVGEMEGGEPIMILSRNTYANNRPVVDKLLHSSLHQNGSAIYQSGGLLNTSKMYSDGGTYESNIDDQIREKRNRELDKKEEQKQRNETQNNAASTASDGNSPAANNGIGDTSAQSASIAENTKYQRDMAKSTGDTVEELKMSNVILKGLVSETQRMNSNLGSLLGSINHNTALIAERTGGIGYLTAIISSRFK